MAITVNYGPIAAALGLAKKAGQGTGYLEQSQRDMQALSLQNQMQQGINSNDANLIQMSMARDEMNARQQQAQQAAAQQEAYRQAQIQQDQQNLALNQKKVQQTDQEFQAQQQTREEQAKSMADARKADSQKKQQYQDFLNGLDQDQYNTVMSGGHIPNDLERQAEARRLDAEAVDRQLKYSDQLQKDREHLSKSVNDPLSNMSPEERLAAADKIKKLNLTIDGINASTGSKLGLGSQTPQAQSSAPIPGGAPSNNLPDAEKLKILRSVSQQMGLPITDPRVITSAASQAPAQAAQFTQVQQREAARQQNYQASIAAQQAANDAISASQKPGFFESFGPPPSYRGI